MTDPSSRKTSLLGASCRSLSSSRFFVELIHTQSPLFINEHRVSEHPVVLGLRNFRRRWLSEYATIAVDDDIDFLVLADNVREKPFDSR